VSRGNCACSACPLCLVVPTGAVSSSGVTVSVPCGRWWL
jgi:hypothetical protein